MNQDARSVFFCACKTKEQSKMKTIKVNEIKCKFDRKTTEQEIKDRGESIKGIGLIHSVKIQSLKDKKFKYQVIAGRKSFAALTQIIGKTELLIPEEVSFIKGDAELIAFAENDERTNLSLAEQVEKLSGLSEKFGITELASHLSHSPQWIAARIRLKELSESWQKAMKENRFEKFVIGHYEAIAKYPQEIQNDIFSYCTSWNFNAEISIAKFAKELEANFTFQIKNAPWNTDGSYQGCGECPACIDRLNNGFLFEEMNDSDKAICQNRQFYFNKLNEFVAGKVEETRKAEPEVLLISQDNSYPEGFPIDEEEIYPAWAWEKTTKKQGGKKALVVNGPLTGKIIFVSIVEAYNNMQNEDGVQEEEPQKKVSTLAERKERKHRQRHRHAISSLMDYIKVMEYEIPDRDTMFRLIACLGVNSIFSYSWDEEHHETGTGGIVAYDTVPEHSELDRAVWKKLITNIISDLKQGQSGSVEAHWLEAEIISRIIAFDLVQAFNVALEALPNPKAWQELERQEQLLAEAKR